MDLIRLANDLIRPEMGLSGLRSNLRPGMVLFKTETGPLKPGVGTSGLGWALSGLEWSPSGLGWAVSGLPRAL